MKFKIIGSGGCVTIPRPTCDCHICSQARKMGAPYSRYGCAMFLEDIRMLIDTPEDIKCSINQADLHNIDYIAYSHVDPDHTMGIRVIEELNHSWTNYSVGITPDKKIEVLARQEVMKAIMSIGFNGYSMLDYYCNKLKIAKTKSTDSTIINDIKIDFVPVEKSTVFVFTQKDKKLVYAPCDCKPFPDEEILYNADCLVMGNTMPTKTFINNFEIADDNPLLDELYTFEKAYKIKEKINAKKMIFTHLEEDYGLTYDDYKEMQTKYDDIEFAYDGMEILL